MMLKLNLRNAFMKGWFAARANRGLPEPGGMAEKVYLDQGYEAGRHSGGQALPMLNTTGFSQASVDNDQQQPVMPSTAPARNTLGAMPEPSPIPPADLDFSRAAPGAQSAPAEAAQNEDMPASDAEATEKKTLRQTPRANPNRYRR